MVSPIPNEEEVFEHKEKYEGAIVYNTQYLSDYFYVFMWVRVIFLLKAIFNFSSYRTQYVQKICKYYNTSPNIWFIFKTELNLKPVRTVFIIFFLSVGMFANMYMVFEMEYLLTGDEQGLTQPLFTSVYIAMVTLSTIGYGDYSPQTVSGRVLIMVMAIWGSILLSLFVTVTAGLFEPSTDENNTINLVNVSRKGAAVIARVYYDKILSRKIKKETDTTKKD